MSLYGYSAASSGGTSASGLPVRSFRNASADGPASQCARSSVSAQITFTATFAYGSDSQREGRKLSRYSCSAGTVLVELKWCANENGRPSMPASCAEKPLEPSSQMAGSLPL